MVACPMVSPTSLCACLNKCHCISLFIYNWLVVIPILLIFCPSLFCCSTISVLASSLQATSTLIPPSEPRVKISEICCSSSSQSLMIYPKATIYIQPLAALSSHDISCLSILLPFLLQRKSSPSYLVFQLESPHPPQAYQQDSYLKRQYACLPLAMWMILIN